MKHRLAQLLGAVAAAFAFGWFNRRFMKRNRKKLLILQLGSDQQAITTEAARLLKLEGWLYDGSLRGVDLWKANLEGVDLQSADLAGANLMFANLANAQLRDANLEGADLRETNLNGADLGGANLRKVHFEGAHHIDQAVFDERTLLPNGQRWKPEMMTWFDHRRQTREVERVLKP